ncbi:MAG: tetratricopeptide repeat protein [Phycisphaerales bacterium]
MNDWVDAEQHVERAHEHYDAGRWDEAENELRRALSLNPYQAEWHFNLGLTLEAAGRPGPAADAFARAYQLHDETGDADAQSALYTAINRIRAGKPGEALEWLDKADRLDATNVEHTVYRIEALAAMNRHEDAEQAFYLAQQVDAEYPELYAAMAESLMSRGKHDKAVWCLREAARLDPSLPRVQARLAEAFAATGRLERARQLYLRELRKDPGDIDTLLDLGELLTDMRRPDEAAEKFRRVLELSPDHADAHFALGDLADRCKDLATALVHFDVVLRLDPTYPGARRRLADLLLSRSRDEDLPRARDLLRLELRASRDDAASFNVEDLEDLGHLLLDADLARDAVGVYRRVLERRAGSHTAHHHLSVALLKTGDVEAGMEQARQALIFEPRFVPAMHNLAVAHMRQRQWMRARYWVKRAARLDPEDVPIRRLRMRLHARWIAGLAMLVVRPALSLGRALWGVTLGRPRRLARA